jgi:hypothetical protein
MNLFAILHFTLNLPHNHAVMLIGALPFVIGGLRTQNILAGIQGFASGGNATVNLNLNERYHDLLFNFATGTANTPTAIASVLQWFDLDVNGTKMLDWTPAMFTEMYRWDGILNNLRTGQLYVPFSGPRFSGLRDNTKTSFDLAGQNSATVTMALQGSLTNPSVVALQDFDNQRNIVPYGPNKGKYFLSPIKRLRQTFTIGGSNAGGLGAQTDITQIPITNKIKRLILMPDNQGTLSHYEIIADNVKIDEGDLQIGSSATWVNDAMTRQLAYGVGGQVAALANTVGVSLPLPSVPLDFTFSRKLSDGLTCKNSLILRVWSNNNGNQNLQIAEEFIGNAFA